MESEKGYRHVFKQKRHKKWNGSYFNILSMKERIIFTPKSALDCPINHVNDQVINITN